MIESSNCSGGRVSITPESEAALNSFGEFAERIRARLDAGKREYGDSSFNRPRGELVDEIQQELLDVVGWSFILYSRLEKLKVLGQLPDQRRSMDKIGHIKYDSETQTLEVKFRNGEVEKREGISEAEYGRLTLASLDTIQERLRQLPR